MSDELAKEEIAALLTGRVLKKIAPRIRKDISDAIKTDAPQIFSDAQINSVVRIAHFFAQIMKEAANLTRLDENLFYTTIDALRGSWPSRFPSNAFARRYLRNPEKLANYVYANRLGNGSAGSGDGWRYRGSGLIQLTGKGNYLTVSQLIGLGDYLVDHPEDARKSEPSVKIAVGYWTARDLNSVANGERPSDVDKVTRLVNRYEQSSGKRERRQNFARILPILRAARSDISPNALTRYGRSLAAQPSMLEYGFNDAREAEEAPVEWSTEPTAEEIRAARLAHEMAPSRFPQALAIPPVYWPRKDENTADYAHLAELQTDTDQRGGFNLSAEDLVLLLKANHFVLPDTMKVVALAFRGATLGGRHEAVRRSVVSCMDVRPDHSNFRCLLGFWHRKEGKITLFSGSTVPCPRYIENYYFKENNLPYKYRIDCNMAPTGRYVFRVGTHDGGKIDPALRMSEPDEPKKDAKAAVWRTSNDLTYGLKDPLKKPKIVYDNVHCSYFVDWSPGYRAYFSSAGCLTVRGGKGPTHQWRKYQKELNKIGSGKRIDLLLFTGKEAALVSQAREAGADEATIIAPLTRLRLGSSGAAVKRLQRKLGVEASGYLGAKTQHALFAWQKREWHTPDAIYSPRTDEATGWGIF